jgi:hypothetical protein
MKKFAVLLCLALVLAGGMIGCGGGGPKPTGTAQPK